MSRLLVFHNHRLVGEHDPRCTELLPNLPITAQPFHRRHDGDDLVVVEDGAETRYPAGSWSAADIDLICAYHVEHGPDPACPRCSP